MSMVTQCPHCTTAFNVTPDQLFERDGRVRCGSCRKVFDGLVNLTSLEALQAGVPPPLAEASDAALQAAPLTAAAPHTSPSHGFTPRNWPMLPDVPVVPLPPLPLEDAVQGVHVAPAPARASRTHAASVPDNAPREPQQIEASADEAEPLPTPHRARWPWALAAVFAGVALCAHVLYTFRGEVAAHFPGVRPALTHMCDWAHCTVPALQRPSVLNILASDLLIVDQAKPHLVQLIVTMQNQSALDIGYPAIDLALNDKFDHVVARRVLLPQEYLRGADAQKTVIAASVTTTVRVDLDVSELSAGGFALLLIAAPQT